MNLLCDAPDDPRHPTSPAEMVTSCERCDRNDSSGAGWMGRCHALNERTIAALVSDGRPGNYVLGYLDGSTFEAFRVGRSDSDLGASLQAWVGAPSRSRPRRLPSHTPWRTQRHPAVELASGVHGRIGSGIDSPYTHFAFCPAPSAITAFERECLAYHEFGGRRSLDNEHHPAPPEGVPCACPVHG